MMQERIRISAFAALVGGFLYIIGDLSTILAVLLPIAVHELGHIIALRLLGLRIIGFEIELRGFCIKYTGCTGLLGEAAAAAAGPLAGILYAVAASAAGAVSDSAWLELTAGVSLLLSVFNLLPAKPLDGGKLFGYILALIFGERMGTKISGAAAGMVCIAAMLAGLWLLFKGYGIAATAAALWLLLCQSEEQGLVNPREIL